MSARLMGLLATARFAEFVAAMALFGTALFPFYATPNREAGDLGLLATIKVALRRVLIVAGCCAPLAAFAWAVATFVEVAGSFAELADPASVWAFFFQTGFGFVWLLRLVAAVLLLVAVLLLRRQLGGRNSATGMVAAFAAALLASQAWIGHPAALNGPERSFVIAAYIVHVLGAATWIGGLVPLAILLAKAKRLGEKAFPATHWALHRFSAVGMVAAAAVLAGGIVNASSRLGSFSALVTSDWGRVLACKIAIFVALIFAAAINRFVLLPRLPERALSTMASLARSIAFEQIAGLLALVAAAWLGILTPPH